MDRDATLAKIEELARRAAETKGLEFVHAELVGTKNNLVVRVFLDKPEGITLDECGAASRDIEGALDVLDLIPSSYVLEVSSPGLERQLYSRDDYVRFAGQNVRLKTDIEFEAKKAFKGKLEAVEGNSAVIIDGSAGRLEIPIANIVRANLVFDINAEFGRTAKKNKASRVA